ncbi:hypothetical protein [Nocardia aurantiaca]|uniref:Uncharacterized protein n=1 Tax=Nocardia aurantiaca TaxID=2675850 RepID=A0A6I3L083_9NOCA|nr:hypothetical protein [Nocardia aurantiaca]MTE15171.1 hypothetical protein [Nocardia aurantiaca]
MSSRLERLGSRPREEAEAHLLTRNASRRAARTVDSPRIRDRGDLGLREDLDAVRSAAERRAAT